jgi:hypothetical protein
VSWSFGLWHWISGHPAAVIAAVSPLATVVLWLSDHRREDVVRGRKDSQDVPGPNLVLISVANGGNVAASPAKVGESADFSQRRFTSVTINVYRDDHSAI